MEKINIAEILKYCPKGMELDCTMFYNVKFDHVDASGDYPIAVTIGEERNYNYLTEYGEWNGNDMAKCVIYPKGKTTWEGFVPPCNFKDGDVIYVRTRLSKWVSIFKEDTGDGIATYADYCLSNRRFYGINDDSRVLCQNNRIYEKRFATEEEKQKLFDAIKDNGYRWDDENKTLEELIKPKFKVGDRIVHKENNVCVPILITNVSDEFYFSNTESSVGCLSIKEQDEWELVPNKFDITTLKPFDSRVLFRDFTDFKWMPALWGYYDESIEESDYPYIICGGVGCKMCIPYEGNENLLGKTEDCIEFYKTWK